MASQLESGDDKLKDRWMRHVATLYTSVLPELERNRPYSHHWILFSSLFSPIPLLQLELSVARHVIRSYGTVICVNITW